MQSAIRFFLLNLAAPVAFFWTYRTAGAKPAIALAIAICLAQALAHAWLRIRLSPFYLVATVFTVGFGSIDLFVATPRFFRLEPFAQNALIGTVFLLSLLTRTPLISWFAHSLPGRFKPRLEAGMERYLRGVTLAWALYLWAKALLFLYLGLKFDLGTLIVLRSVIGGATLALMIGGEIIYRKLYRQRRGRRPPAGPTHSARSG